MKRKELRKANLQEHQKHEPVEHKANAVEADEQIGQNGLDVPKRRGGGQVRVGRVGRARYWLVPRKGSRVPAIALREERRL